MANNKSSLDTIREMHEEAGWTVDSQLHLACEYIDGLIGGREGFERFLKEVAKDEAEDAEDAADPLGLG